MESLLENGEKEELNTMAKRISIKPGDIFRLPLMKGTFKYIQFIRVNKEFLGLDLVRAYSYESNDIIKEENLDYFLENLLTSSIMFYVYVDTIKLGIKLFNWQKVMNSPLEQDFIEPKFLSRELLDINDLNKYSWFLNSKNKKESLGFTLDNKYHDLPFQSGKNPKIITEIMEIGYDKYNLTKKYLNS